MQKKIKTVFFDVDQTTLSFLKKNQPTDFEFIYIKGPLTPKTCKDKKIQDAQILSVFVSSTQTYEAVLKNFPNLKLIVTRSTGYNHIDLNYCKAKKIKVANVPQYGQATVAEFTFSLLLNLTRKVNMAYQNLKDELIKPETEYMGIDLHEKTLGVIGTGSIGCHVIQIANGFGMNVLAYDPFPKKELEKKYPLKYVPLNTLYKTADIISLHCPLMKQTHHILDQKAFEKMKKGVIIINTARGELIETKALYKALKNKIVSAAGLDVLEYENLVIKEEKDLGYLDSTNRNLLIDTLLNERLIDMDNVIVTPHIAFDTKEAVHRILSITLKNMINFSKNKKIDAVI